VDTVGLTFDALDRMAEQARGVAIGVVGRRCPGDGCEAISGGVVRGQELVRAARFVDVAEGIVAEGLRGGGAAIRAGDTGEVVMRVSAGLRAGAVELVRDGELPAKERRESGEDKREFEELVKQDCSNGGSVGKGRVEQSTAAIAITLEK